MRKYRAVKIPEYLCLELESIMARDDLSGSFTELLSEVVKKGLEPLKSDKPTEIVKVYGHRPRYPS